MKGMLESKREIDVRFKKLNMLADATINKSREMLNKHGKVMVVRPTGFGKTRMIVKLGKIYSQEQPEKRILYVYPIDVIKTEVMSKEDYMKDGIIKDNFDFVSYWSLTNRMTKHGIEYWIDEIRDKYSLIILDEVHREGSDSFNVFYEGVKDTLNANNIHMIGVTATPRRMMDDEDNNVLTSIFDNCEIEPLTLFDLIKQGVMPQPIYVTCDYDADEEARQFKKEQMAKCRRLGKRFDEDKFNMEYSKCKNFVMAHSTIYDGIKKAGYNLANDKERYFKFIVFFTSIEDMANRGPQVEEWFDMAFNENGKRDTGFRGDFDINSYYVASGDTASGDIENLVNEKPEHRDFFKKTRKLNTVTTKNKTVDLLFTVNMINMGYHVDNISGVVLLRGTGSEIVYYQQLGRCLSVTSMRSPIIYDFVKNVRLIEDVMIGRKRSARDLEEDKIVTPKISNTTTEVKDKDKYTDELLIVVNRDIMGNLLDKWSDTDYSEKAEVEWLYCDRNTPICVIASTLDKTCQEVVDILNELCIELKDEDDMYRYQEAVCKSKVGKSGYVKEVALLRYIFSNKVNEFFSKLGKAYTTLFDIITGKRR